MKIKFKCLILNLPIILLHLLRGMAIVFYSPGSRLLEPVHRYAGENSPNVHFQPVRSAFQKKLDFGFLMA